VRLSELLTPARILVPLHATDKEGVLRELVDVAAVGNGGPSDEVLGAILERERQFPTGIGYGVAVPHGKTPVLSALVIVAGPRCRTKRSMASRSACSFSWPVPNRAPGPT